MLPPPEAGVARENGGVHDVIKARAVPQVRCWILDIQLRRERGGRRVRVIGLRGEEIGENLLYRAWHGLKLLLALALGGMSLKGRVRGFL